MPVYHRQPTEIDHEQRALLRTLAMAADDDGRRWFVRSGLQGYPQSVLGVGNVAVIAECYDGPQDPPVHAPFIAAVSPPVVLALLDRLAALEEPSHAH